MSLLKTLESNLITLSGAHFFWLLDNNDSIAQRIADHLIARYPGEHIIKLNYAAPPEGLNPKLFKLHQAFPLCKTPYCFVLDDDTTLSDKTLQALLAELETHTVVTGLPEYQQGGNFPSKLLSTFVNNNASCTYLSLLPYMAPITINGMCYGFKRQPMQELGGFEPILRHLTDDLALAEHVLSKGGTICQVPCKQMITTSLVDFRHYIRQMHRWYVFANILFFKQTPCIRFVIFTLYGLTPLLFLWLLLLTLIFPTPLNVCFLLLILLIRQAALRLKIKPACIFFSVLSESLQSLHLIHAFCCRKIHWRSRYYRVLSNSKFTNAS